MMSSPCGIRKVSSWGETFSHGKNASLQRDSASGGMWGVEMPSESWLTFRLYRLVHPLLLRRDVRSVPLSLGFIFARRRSLKMCHENFVNVVSCIVSIHNITRFTNVTWANFAGLQGTE